MKRRRSRRGATRRLRLLLLALVTLAAAAIGVVLYATAVLATPEGATIDARFHIRGHQAAPKNLALVAIDTQTLNDLNNWPLARSYYAQLINKIAPQHPAAIVFDIDMENRSTIGNTCKIGTEKFACDDITLLTAINSNPGITVFSTTEPSLSGDGQTLFMGSAKGTTLLGLVHSRPGAALFPLNQPGGIYRQMVYDVQNIPTLYVAAAEVATHKKVTRAQFGGDRWIDFPGPEHTIPWISFANIINPKKYGAPTAYGSSKPLPADYFRGKIVFVGVTDVSLEDYHATPTDAQMTGAEIEADATATILEHFPLNSVPGWINIALIIVLAVAVPLASLRLSPVPTLALAVTLAAAFAVGTQLAFDSGKINSFVYPMGTLILSASGALAVQLVTEAFERIRTVDLFSRFVPENVVDEVLASSDGLRLGGVQRSGTVMFSDLRGFTSMAETLEPSQVIDTLNHYLSEMSDAILDHGGTLVAYMGDGIMAVFGAPLAQEDHADRALAAALEMINVRLPRFNEWLRSEGLSNGFKMGVGLNSGHVMSGHVGSERRVEYTAVGDTTNTASRIEALTKGTPYQLLLAESTRDGLVQPPGDEFVFVEETEIRGRQAKIKLWTLESTRSEITPATTPPAPAPTPTPA